MNINSKEVLNRIKMGLDVRKILDDNFMYVEFFNDVVKYGELKCKEAADENKELEKKYRELEMMDLRNKYLRRMRNKYFSEAEKYRKEVESYRLCLGKRSIELDDVKKALKLRNEEIALLEKEVKMLKFHAIASSPQKCYLPKDFIIEIASYIDDWNKISEKLPDINRRVIFKWRRESQKDEFNNYYAFGALHFNANLKSEGYNYRFIFEKKIVDTGDPIVICGWRYCDE